ncbi:hypothetical protein [Streptomyces sp. P17]|uniref:hypothetical protein n=1 Tax=Streptomyces sp. P17 TaxID=3074716 RepID=UPI0028F412FD|nr:hypothetical protein [Streptomyces sp. P17]MDT9700630.1 hypothetical protein [Streptomyces sp. P17]
MPADEVTHGTDVDTSRARTGPRHAAPKKPLFTRFHMPAGKAIALAAMPTAVLMGMGFTPTLANAEDQPASRSLTADEYKDCVAALEGESASPSPSVSESASESPAEDDTAEPTPTPSASTGGDSSSDSGSDEEAEPTPSPSETSQSTTAEPQSGAGGTATASPSPSPSESDGNLLEDIGDAIEGIFTPGDDATASASPSPSATPSATPSASESPSAEGSDPVKETTDEVTGTVGDAVKDTTDAASEAAEATGKAVEEAAEEVTATPSPSASSTTDPGDCPAATDDKGGVDNTVPLPDDPWYLNASSLLLKGADYQGIVKVRTANGTTKDVLKYVISDGTDIGDLHQTVKDPQSGKTYHVQAGAGTTSTIRDGKTIMYTESISGNLLGLIPVTFSPENPPPLNIPLIYFTKVKVVQAGQFGGTLHVPGLRQFTTD